MSADFVKPETNKRYTIMIWTCLCIVINYIDRVNFGVATPTIMEVFKLNSTQIGIMGSAFFIPYMLMMIPTGYMLNRFGPKRVMGGALFMWGLSTMATAFAFNFGTFFATRIAMGIFEAPGYPSASRVTSVWIPNRERTFWTGFFDGCARIGMVFAPPLVVWIIINWGWQASFVVTGGLAVGMGILWQFVYFEPDDHPTVSKSELAYIRQEEVTDDVGKVVKVPPIPMSRFIFYAPLVRVSLAYGCYLYVWNTFTAWMPAFFIQARGFDMKTMGLVVMLPYLTAILLELLAGHFLFDKWYRKGGSLTAIRRTGMSISLFGSALFICLAIMVEDPFWIVAFLTAFAGISGFGAGNVQTPPVDLSPYGQAGGFSGFYAFGGALGSFFAPMATGFMISTEYGFEGGFFLSACVAALGAILYCSLRYDRLTLRPADQALADKIAASGVYK